MGATTDMQLAGTALKAGSSVFAGDAKAKEEQANAGIADQQAKSEMAAGSYNADLQRRKAAMITGNQVAAIGANNLQQRGTPSQVVATTAQAQEGAALMIQNNALRRAWGFEVQGASDKYQGQLAKQGGILSGIGDLAAGTAGAYNRNEKEVDSDVAGVSNFNTGSLGYGDVPTPSVG